MAEFWETSFVEKDLMWGQKPTDSAVYAAEYFHSNHAAEILIPGIGYGRNAIPFLEKKMSVTGIEISETAIKLARNQMGFKFPIHHGSVDQMPFDRRTYDGIFCHGLIYLLSSDGRNKLIRDCFNQLNPGGSMVFTVISKNAPMYGEGRHLGKDLFERLPGVQMFFYGSESIKREFEPFGLIDISEVDEPNEKGDTTLPFFAVYCRKSDDR